MRHFDHSSFMHWRGPAVLVVAAAIVALLALPLAASAATVETQPAAGNARTFATGVGGWSSTVTECAFPGVTCPDGTASFQAAGGTGGAGDGFLRSRYDTLLGIVSSTNILWQSPSFTSTQPTDTGTLNVSVRSNMALLLGLAGSAKLSMVLVDTADATRNVTLGSGIDIPNSTGFAPISATVPAGAMTQGRSYRIALRSTVNTGVATLAGTGLIDYDDVSLDSVDLLPPSGLTASADTSGAARIDGSVNPQGQTTTVVAQYGPSAGSYTSSTAPVSVSGSGPQGFTIPFAGLTAGDTVHYRLVATNPDGTTATSDASFTVPAAPANSPPVVNGPLNSRDRTVVYDQTPGTVGVTAQVLQGGSVVSSTSDPTPGDGTLTISLPDADGDYSVRLVRANSGGSSSTSDGVPTSLDRMAPSTAGLNLSVDPLVSSSRQRTVSYDLPADATSASAQVLDSGGNPVGAPVTGAGGLANVQLGAADGSYTVRLTVRDAAGNTATADSATATLDSSAPGAGDAPTVTGAGNVRTRSVTFDLDLGSTAVVEVRNAAGTVVDTQPALLGSATVTLGTTDGVYAVRVIQTDLASNQAISPPASVTLDRQPPSAGGAPTVTGDGSSRSRTVTFDRDPSSTSATVEVRDAGGTLVDSVAATGNTAAVTLGSADGAYRVTVTQTDAATNSATSPEAGAVLDTVPPTAGPAPTVTGNDNARARTVTFTRASDAATAVMEVRSAAGSLVSSTPASGNSGAITLPAADGAYTVRVVQTDAAGNAAATPSASVTLARGSGTGTGTGTTGGGLAGGGGSKPNPGGGSSGGGGPRTLTDAQILALIARIKWQSETGTQPGGGVIPRSTCTIVGTKGNDRIVGTTGNDVICGLGGKDVIDGRGGNDVIDGGDGNDRLSGGAGADLLIGLRGIDRLDGGSGNDRLSGGSGRDREFGGSGNDRIYGGNARDRVSGGSGADRITGGRDGDSITGGSGRDAMNGGPGDDRIYARDGGRDRVLGATGRDYARVDRGTRVARPKRDRVTSVERVR